MLSCELASSQPSAAPALAQPCHAPHAPQTSPLPPALPCPAQSSSSACAPYWRRPSWPGLSTQFGSGEARLCFATCWGAQRAPPLSSSARVHACLGLTRPAPRLPASSAPPRVNNAAGPPSSPRPGASSWALASPSAWSPRRHACVWPCLPRPAVPTLAPPVAANPCSERCSVPTPLLPCRSCGATGCCAAGPSSTAASGRWRAPRRRRELVSSLASGRRRPAASYRSLLARTLSFTHPFPSPLLPLLPAPLLYLPSCCYHHCPHVTTSITVAACESLFLNPSPAARRTGVVERRAGSSGRGRARLPAARPGWPCCYCKRPGVCEGWDEALDWVWKLICKDRRQRRPLSPLAASWRRAAAARS